MMNPLTLLRRNIAALTPYSTARDEYTGKIGTFLDANENPYENGFNRYPDPRQKELKAKLSKIKGISPDQIFIGNGSDEAIDLCFRIFCEPREDNFIAIAPSYGMYNVAAAINDIEYREVLLNEDFSLPIERLLSAADSHTKLMFICSPNNPSANSFRREDIISLASRFAGMIVLDEAYIDFSKQRSLISDIEKIPNLIILQTLSKAWGMAGLRLGLAYSSKEIIDIFGRVKYPYNIDSAAMQEVDRMLDRDIRPQVEEIKVQRDKVSTELAKFSCILKVFPSDANFILVRTKNANTLYYKLLQANIIVRNRTKMPLCKDCLRITIGTPEENSRMLEVVSNFDSGIEAKPQSKPLMSERKVTVERDTKETKIKVTLDLDGNGESMIDSGLKFFDHMLDQIAHHSGIGLYIQADGDLEVDQHHTMEDVAITLGEAITKALGDKRGIERYGFVLPMDDCDAMVLMDLGGRIDFSWNVPFTRDMVGDTPTEMFRHFFKSLCEAMKCNMHIEARGENNHHLAEAVFKAFARALKAAIRRDPFHYTLPSSKGLL